MLKFVLNKITLLVYFQVKKIFMDYDMLLGLFMFYVWGHFFVIQFQKDWSNRNGYEKFLTIAAIVFLLLLIIGLS